MASFRKLTAAGVIVVATGVGVVIAVAVGLWWHFGNVIFFEFIRSGMPLCG